jgi:ABC-2 type transport system permease protein
VKIVSIAGSNLKRMFRDRTSIFFIFIFPMALVLLLGLQFGGRALPQLGLYVDGSGVMADRVVNGLAAEPEIEIVRFDTSDRLVAAVERGSVEAALTIPAGFDEAIRGGETADVMFVARPSGLGASLRPVIDRIIGQALLPVAAARFAVDQQLTTFEGALQTAEQMEAAIAPVEVSTQTVGEALFPSTLGRFDLGASSQLILFMFITALSGGAVLIQTRQLGLSRRMLSTPSSVRTILTGEALGRFVIVLVQGLYIVIGTWLIFSVNWGNPLGAAAILILFAAVGAGAAMLIGTLFSNAEQAGGVAVMMGLGLAALGGCMLPLQLFSPTLRRIAHVTPHAWAVDGFAKLVQEGGTFASILPELGVLAAFATALLLISSWRLRAAITRS